MTTLLAETTSLRPGTTATVGVRFALRVSGRDSFRITGKPQDGTWRYVLEIHGDRFGSTLGMSDEQALGVVTPVVDVFVGDLQTGLNVYRAELTLGYSVRRGRDVARQ